MPSVTELPPNMQNKIHATPNGCWEWTGSLNNKGYGQVGHGGKTSSTHRVAYTILVGAIPDGLHIDHLCRNRSCCNPDHLEAVPLRTNTLRGVSFSAVNAVKTRCRKGHEYTAENTYVDSRGSRSCRTCRANSHKRAAA